MAVKTVWIAEFVQIAEFARVTESVMIYTRSLALHVYMCLHALHNELNRKIFS